MTCLAVISDIHAHLTCLDSVLQDAQARGAEQIICLGDIVDLGPQPSAVIERLQQANIRCISGNHDPLNEHPEHPFLQAVEQWTREQLSAQQQQWLNTLPFSLTLDIAGHKIHCVHGTPASNNQGITSDTSDTQLDAWLTTANADLLLCGHTHVPLIRQTRQGLVANVGSTSMPFAQAFEVPPRILPYSDYLLVHAQPQALTLEPVRLPLDLQALTQAVEHSGMPYGSTLLSSYPTA